MTDVRVVLVVGTRPEAIKMAPVCWALERAPGVETVLVSTGQHRELLKTALEPLNLVPDYDLAVMEHGQSPNAVAQRVLARLSPLLEEMKPEALLVQGDTTTVLAAALTAYNLRVPLGHVEAGLRTYDHTQPFPEEGNRQLVDRLATWCFVPTESAAENLRRERVPEDTIFVTGNTAVDSLLWMIGKQGRTEPGGDTVLVTLHRRESFGEPLRNILLGIRDFAEATSGARVLWPVHPNPHVVSVADEILGGLEAVTRVAPLDYASFARALASARLVLTDSGGIQEEAPSLGKVVLVARQRTERPEGLASARNRLVGRSREGVRRALMVAWKEETYQGPLPAANPYGDGHAGERIAGVLMASLGAAAEGEGTRRGERPAAGETDGQRDGRNGYGGASLEIAMAQREQLCLERERLLEKTRRLEAENLRVSTELREITGSRTWRLATLHWQLRRRMRELPILVRKLWRRGR